MTNLTSKLRQFIAVTLALLLCLPGFTIPAAASEPVPEPSYSVDFYEESDKDNTVTFQITASAKPEQDTDVYYRVWSGDSQGAVVAETGHVTFKVSDYTESSTARYVKVQLKGYDEDLSRYSVPESSVGNSASSANRALPHVNLMLLGVAGSGQIDWDHQTASRELPARQDINLDVLYDANSQNNEFYVTNSIQLDFSSIPPDAEDLPSQMTAEGTGDVEIETSKVMKTAFGALKAVVTESVGGYGAFLFKLLTMSVNGTIEASTGYSMGAYILGLHDIDPSTGFTVNFLRNEDDGAYIAGDAADGTKYDNAYYELIDAEYLVYLEGEAHNMNYDHAIAENVELRVYEMPGKGFGSESVDSSNGNSWNNATLPDGSVQLLGMWEDYTKFTKANAKTSAPNESGSADAGMRNFEVDKVKPLDQPIVVPFSNDASLNNNLAGYEPARTSVSNVFVLDNPTLGYYLELPKMSTVVDGTYYFRLENNYIYYMVRDTAAPKAVGITLSNDQYGLRNEIRASVEFDELIANCEGAVVEVWRDGGDKIATLSPQPLTGGNRVEFVGTREDDGTFALDEVDLMFTASKLSDAAGNETEGEHRTFWVKNYPVRMVKALDVVQPADPLVSAKSNGAAYTAGTRTVNPVTLTATSSANSGIRMWQVRDANSDGDWINLTDSLGNDVPFGSYTIDLGKTLSFTVNNTGLYDLQFRAVAESGLISNASEPFAVNYRNATGATGTFKAHHESTDSNGNINFSILRTGGDEGRFRVSYQFGYGNTQAARSATAEQQVIFADGDDAAKELTLGKQSSAGWFEVEGGTGEYVDLIITKVERDSGRFDDDGGIIWEDVTAAMLSSTDAVATGSTNNEAKHELSAMYLANGATHTTTGSLLAKSAPRYSKPPYTTTRRNISLTGADTNSAFLGTQTFQMYQDMGARLYYRVSGNQDMQPRNVLYDKDLTLSINDVFTGWEDTNNVDAESFDLPGSHHFNNYTQTTDSSKIQKKTVTDTEEDYYTRDFGNVVIDADLPAEEYLLEIFHIAFTYTLNYEISWFAEDEKAPKVVSMSGQTQRYSDGDWLYVRVTFSEPVMINPGTKLAVRKSSTQAEYGTLSYKRGNGSYTLLFSGKLEREGDSSADSGPIYLSDPNVTISWPVGGTVSDMMGNEFTGFDGKSKMLTLDGVPIDANLPDITVKDGGTFSITKMGETSIDGIDYYTASIQRSGAREGDQSVYVRTFNENAEGYFEPLNTLLTWADDEGGTKTVYIRKLSPDPSSMEAYSHDTEDANEVFRYFGVEIYNVFGGGKAADNTDYLENPGGFTYTEGTGPDDFPEIEFSGGQATPAARIAVSALRQVKQEALQNNSTGPYTNMLYTLSDSAIQGNEPYMTLSGEREVCDYYEAVPGTTAMVVARFMTVRVSSGASAKNVDLYLTDERGNALFHGYEDYTNLTTSPNKLDKTNFFPGYSQFNHNDWCGAPVNVSGLRLRLPATPSFDERSVSEAYLLDSAYVHARIKNGTKYDVEYNRQALFYLYQDKTAPAVVSASIDKDYTLPGRVVRASYTFSEIVYANNQHSVEQGTNSTVSVYAQTNSKTPLIDLEYVSGYGTNTLTFQGVMPENILPDNLAMQMNHDVYDNAGNMLAAGQTVDNDLNLRNAPEAPTFSYSYVPSSAADGYYAEAIVTMTCPEQDTTIYYSLDGHSEDSFYMGETGTGTASVRLTEYGLYNIHAMAVRESDGIKSPVSVSQTVMIDDTSPSINVWHQGDGWTNDDVLLFYLTYGGLTTHTVTVQRQDEDILQEPVDITAYSTYWARENGVYRFTVSNDLGRSAYVDVKVDFIDKIAPVLTSASFARGKEDAGNIPVYVSATVAESQSGLDHFRYYFDYYDTDKAWQKTNLGTADVVKGHDDAGNPIARFVITAPAGTGHVLHLFPVDAAGNVDYVNSGSISGVPPSIENLVNGFKSPSPIEMNPSDLRMVSNFAEVEAEPPALTVTPSAIEGWVSSSGAFKVEAESLLGLQELRWTVLSNGSEVSGMSGAQYPGGATSSRFWVNPRIDETGAYTLKVTAVDRGGNTSIANIPLQVDVDKPLPPTLLVNGEAFDASATHSITDGFQLRAPDQEEGQSPVVAQIKVEDEWKDAIYGGIQVQPGQYAVTARTVDAAGNLSEEVDFTVYVKQPDEVYATVSAVYTSQASTEYTGQWTNSNVTFELDMVAEEGTSLEDYSYAYSTDGGDTWAKFESDTFTAEQSGNYLFGALANDQAAPRVYVSTAYSVCIDITAPQKPSMSEEIDLSGWIGAESLIFTWDSSSEGSTQSAPESLQYRINDGAWIDAVNGKVPLNSGQYSLAIRVVDAAGNESEVVPHCIKVDNAPPAVALRAAVMIEGSMVGGSGDSSETRVIDIVEGYDGSVTRHNVLLTIVAEAPSGIESVTYVDSHNQSPSPLTANAADGTYTLDISTNVDTVYSFNVKSNTGKTTIVSQKVHIDKTPPGSASIAITRGTGDTSTADGFYSVPPTISVKLPNEEGASVGYVLWKDGTAGPLTALPEGGIIPTALFTGDGAYKLSVYAQDAAGNVSSTTTDQSEGQSKDVSFFLDSTSPTLAASQQYGITDIPTSEITLNASNFFHDANTLSYCFTPYTLDEDHAWTKGDSTSNNTGQYSVSSGFTGRVEVYAIDPVGNTSPIYSQFYLNADSTIPAVSVKIEGEKDPSEQWYCKSAPKVTMQVTDTGSGIQGLRVSVYHNGVPIPDASKSLGVNGDKELSYSRVVTQSGRYLILATAVDMRGNVSGELFTQFQVDLTPPAISGLDESGLVNGHMAISVTDPHSGVASVKYQLVRNGSTLSDRAWVEAEEHFTISLFSAFTGTVYVRAADHAGNVITKSCNVTYAPFVPPASTTVTIPVSGEENTVHAEVTVSGSAVEVKPLDPAEIEQIVGDDVQTGVVEIDLSGLDSGVTQVTLPVETLEAITQAAEDAGNDTESIAIIMPQGTVEIDDAAMRAVLDQAAGNAVILVLEDTGNAQLNEDQRAAIEGQEVHGGFEAYFECAATGERIGDFKGGTATLSVPFAVPEGKKGSGFSVWYVSDGGEVQRMKTFHVGGRLMWHVPHMSDYVVVYEDHPAYEDCEGGADCPLAQFPDVKLGAWYHDGLHWAVENGALKGGDDGRMMPDAAIDRQTLMVVLHRYAQAAGMNTAVHEDADVLSFGDAADVSSWAMGSMRWAVGSGVMKGYDTGLLGPRDVLTREQTATFLHRFAAYLGMGVSEGEDTNILSFADAFEISEWAMPAMQWACGSGVIGGYADAAGNQTGELGPADGCTRAQAATMLMRFDAIA